MNLVMLRYETGTVYPAYSSYRSDPLGVRALYGALDSITGVSVRRNIEPFKHLGRGRDRTLIFCGATISDDPVDVIESLETFATDGGRLVISFYPVVEEPQKKLRSDDEHDEDGGGSKADGKDANDRIKPDAPWNATMVSVEDRWGFSYAFAPLPESTDTTVGEGYATRQVDSADLADSMVVHTAMYFDDIEEPWTAVYSREEGAVAMERSWGKGSIVLISDSYLLSNEAMFKDRQPGFISWLIGPSSMVVFDETHFGYRQGQGVMTLAWRYGLQGVLAALVLMAVLYVWKNAVVLVPRRANDVMRDADVMEGRPASAGLVNLLRRSISSKEVVAVCIREWKHSFERSPKSSGDKIERIESIARTESARSLGKRDPVSAYKAICGVLAEKD